MTNPIVKNAVNRFLGWRLPEDFQPDCGIVFDQRDPIRISWPTGTNLFTADQAEAMFEHCLQPAQSSQFGSAELQAMIVQHAALKPLRVEPIYDRIDNHLRQASGLSREHVRMVTNALGEELDKIDTVRLIRAEDRVRELEAQLAGAATPPPAAQPESPAKTPLYVEDLIEALHDRDTYCIAECMGAVERAVAHDALLTKLHRLLEEK